MQRLQFWSGSVRFNVFVRFWRFRKKAAKAKYRQSSMRRTRHNEAKTGWNGKRETLTCNENEDFLCVLKNGSSERFSVCIFSCAPTGKSFTISQEVTLEPEGQCSFITCLAHDLVVRTPFGVFTLVSSNGKPLITPSAGIDQKLYTNPISSMPNVVLWCKFWSISQQLQDVATASTYETVPHLLSTLPTCTVIRDMWEQNPPTIPEESTILILEDSMLHDNNLIETMNRNGLERFVIPSTLFVRPNGEGSTRTQDDSSKVSLRGNGSSMIVEIDPSDKWPLLTLTGPRLPYRLDNIWIVCYVMQRIL
uniref:Uncharacterized protein n=1 Tax=viral metagenome TaxID=1070528 RepID=A0A6C0BZV0_9ZZZZ